MLNVSRRLATDVNSDVTWRRVSRLRVYDAFSSELRPFRASAVPDSPLVAVAKRVEERLVGAGLNEVRPMPFVTAGKGATVRVTNPLAEDEAFLRGDLLTTLISRAEYNLARMQGNVRLFEIGPRSSPRRARPLPGPKKPRSRERNSRAALAGQRSPTLSPPFT